MVSRAVRSFVSILLRVYIYDSSFQQNNCDIGSSIFQRNIYSVARGTEMYLLSGFPGLLVFAGS